MERYHRRTVEQLGMAGENRITRVEDLKKVINLTAEEESGIQKALETLRMGITPIMHP
jgi:L-lysine 2,3-aminomutase